MVVMAFRFLQGKIGSAGNTNMPESQAPLAMRHEFVPQFNKHAENKPSADDKNNYGSDDEA
jgi:hypothetical protein